MGPAGIERKFDGKRAALVGWGSLGIYKGVRFFGRGMDVGFEFWGGGDMDGTLEREAPAGWIQSITSFKNPLSRPDCHNPPSLSPPPNQLHVPNPSSPGDLSQHGSRYLNSGSCPREVI